MRMVQYVIQVQQLGLRVGAQKNRLNGIEVMFLNTYYVFLDLEERFLLLLLNTPESIWWSGCYYGDVQTVAPLE